MCCLLCFQTVIQSTQFDSFMTSIGTEFLHLADSNASTINHHQQQQATSTNGTHQQYSAYPSTTTAVRNEVPVTHDSRESSLSFITSTKLQPVGGSTNDLLAYSNHSVRRSTSVNPALLKANSVKRQLTADSTMSQFDGEQGYNATIPTDSIPLDTYDQPAEEMNWLPSLDKRKTSQTHTTSILDMQFPQLASFDIYLNTELE